MSVRAGAEKTGQLKPRFLVGELIGVLDLNGNLVHSGPITAIAAGRYKTKRVHVGDVVYEVGPKGDTHKCCLVNLDDYHEVLALKVIDLMSSTTNVLQWSLTKFLSEADRTALKGHYEAILALLNAQLDTDETCNSERYHLLKASLSLRSAHMLCSKDDAVRIANQEIVKRWELYQ